MTPFPTAARRRWRIGAMTGVLILAATVALVVANVLGARLAVRWDVTAAGEHALSPRTLAVLSRLEGSHEIVIAGPLGDRAAVDQQAKQRVEDVLAQLRRRGGGRVSATLIDTTSGAGLNAYQDLLHRLTDRDAANLVRQTDTVTSAAGRAEQIAASLDALSPRFLAIQASIPEDSPSAAANRAYFEQRAAEARLSARGLRELAGKARTALSTRLDPLPIPDADSAREHLQRPLADLEPGLTGIVDNLRKFAAAETIPAGARDAARPLIDEVAAVRDLTAVTRDSLERLPRLEVSRIAGALRASSVAMVIGPADRGLSAVEFGSLLPAPASGATHLDHGRHAEELLGTALGLLASPNRPIVVLMHAQTRAAMERLPFFDAIGARLSMRGVDLLPWAVAETAEPPSIARIDPSGKRPVVYVCFNTAGFSGGGPGQAGQSGQERTAKLAAALRRLIDAGHPLLHSLMVSTAPSYGEKDPTSDILTDFGLEADPGRPLLRERLTPAGRRVEAFQHVQPDAGDHPILWAVRGLPTRFEWPLSITTAPASAPRATVTPLYRIADASVWAESQWLNYFQVPISQHPTVPNPPANDSPRDGAQGPWVVAAAAERTLPGATHPQRLVVVGSNFWFLDPALREGRVVDGRTVEANPGNAELFEASIYWLAGQDDLIAQSATARAVPLIGDLSPAALLALKLAATLGLPAVVLAAGVVYRVWRG